jgi:radical SAM protein with 4Fe4S-binding SPASM domain
VLHGIDRMLAAGVNVGLGITLHPGNEGQLPKIKEWAATKSITDIDARYAYPKSNPMWPDVDLESRSVMPFNNCHAALYQLYVDSDGSVYPCCITAGDTRSVAQGTALGNIYSEEWSVVWQRVVAYTKRDVSQLPEICRTCCVQRLSEINHTCGNTPLTPSFF